MFTYFVSYSGRGELRKDKYYNSRTSIERENKISSIKDIADIEREILETEYGMDNIIILNYILFGEGEKD